MSPPSDLTQRLRALAAPVARLQDALYAAEHAAAGELRAVDPTHAASARNLVHYLALRRHELRDLQAELAAVGLSSLGRAESCVAATIANVMDLLACASGAPAAARDGAILTVEEGRRLLERNTCGLLGSTPRTRHVRVLVTFPTEAADDPRLVRALMRGGMDVARINCAHDDAGVWARMIDHVRRASSELGRPCRVLMDLAGPKLRTGALAPGPAVVKVKPLRDPLGAVRAPARIWLGAGAGPDGAIALPLDAGWARGLAVGESIDLVDARGKERAWIVREVAPGGALAEATRTAYVVPGTRLSAGAGDALVGALPPCDTALQLCLGDRLLVTRDDVPGAAGPPPHIPCTLPQVFGDVRRGDRIWFDDGALGGRVLEVAASGLTVEITDARPGGVKLRADKGINLPDTALRLPALDARDEAALEFIAAHGDLVGYSFVRRPSDVVALQERLAALGRPDLGVVLKIETRDAFEQLPQLLLAAMRRPQVGVMIARGDLAVECGWQRLAELQEEILWICESAHLPVIWATQVLEQLATQGRPSRAEITDAAMAERAECVMLNKGAHLVEAVAVLDDILRRMEGHQSKKRSMLRALTLAERFALRRAP